jgi:hypothetical protein
VDTKTDNSNTIRLDVYELKDYKPVLTYRINVFDKIITSVDNNDVPKKGAYKSIDMPVVEKLVLYDFTDIEKFKHGSQLTHKFKIKSFGKKFLYLNLTDNDLVKLGFMEKPPIIIFKLNENKRWIIGLLVMAMIGIAAIIFNNSKGSKASDTKDTKQIQQEEKTKYSMNKSEFSQSDSLTVPVDTTNIKKKKKLNEL